MPMMPGMHPGAMAGMPSFASTEGKRRYADSNEMTAWGTERMTKLPHAPAGMQFVNIDNLIDFTDLENFRDKMMTAINKNLDVRSDLQEKRIMSFNEKEINKNKQLIEKTTAANMEDAHNLIDSAVEKLEEEQEN